MPSNTPSLTEVLAELAALRAKVASDPNARPSDAEILAMTDAQERIAAVDDDRDVRVGPSHIGRPARQACIRRLRAEHGLSFQVDPRATRIGGKPFYVGYKFGGVGPADVDGEDMARLQAICNHLADCALAFENRNGRHSLGFSKPE